MSHACCLLSRFTPTHPGCLRSQRRQSTPTGNKIQLGKLQLQDPLPEILRTQQSTNGLQMLPIHLDHTWALAGLPDYHRDPFDRLLIAQAIATQLPIVSADSMFDPYPIQRIW